MMTLSESIKNELIQAARKIRNQAYAPYSNFSVGAALVTQNGQIFSGVNVENASYGLTICAERHAVGQMIAGGEEKIVGLAVATINGVTPCGACRQVLREFGENFPVWLIAEESGEIRETSLAQLIPDSFNSSQLPES